MLQNSHNVISDDEWAQIVFSLPNKGLGSPTVPLETLWKATMKHFNERILLEVVTNPNLDSKLAEYILDRLPQNFSSVLYRLLDNPVTPESSILKLWMNPSFNTYRGLILRIGKVTAPIVWLGLLDSDPQTKDAAKTVFLNPDMRKKVLVHGLKFYAGVENISEDLPLDWLMDVADTFGINVL